MADEKKVITLDDFEQRLMVSGLMDFRNDLLKEEKPTEDINDLILKVIDAPTKKEYNPLSLRHYSGCVARPSDCALYGKRFGELDPRVRNRDGKPIPNKALRGQRKNCPRFAFGLWYRHRCVPFHGAQLQTA